MCEWLAPWHSGVSLHFTAEWMSLILPTKDHTCQSVSLSSSPQGWVLYLFCWLHKSVLETWSRNKVRIIQWTHWIKKYCSLELKKDERPHLRLDYQALNRKDKENYTPGFIIDKITSNAKSLLKPGHSQRNKDQVDSRCVILTVKIRLKNFNVLKKNPNLESHLFKCEGTVKIFQGIQVLPCKKVKWNQPNRIHISDMAR